MNRTEPRQEPRGNEASGEELGNQAGGLTAGQRRGIYCLLMLAALAVVSAKIASIVSISNYEAKKAERTRTPMLSANDRSRWCTIRAIVDYGTFAVDEVIYDEEGKRVNEWQTIDLVQHRNIDGEPRYYSSKPPLLPAMLAGYYWVVKRVTGTTMGEQPLFVIRLLLFLINVPCLALILWWISSLAERYAGTDWGRIVIVATACMGTFLTTFSVTLNNHLFAAFGVTGALVGILKIGRDRDASWWCFFATGLAAAFGAANELPALSMLCIVFAAAVLRNPLAGTVGTGLGIAVVVVAFFAVNWFVHHSLRPPYAHRGLGEKIASLPAKEFSDPDAPEPREVRAQVDDFDWPVYSLRVFQDDEGRRNLWDRSGPVLAMVRQNDTWNVHRWDDWYDYPIDKRPGQKARSYWKRERSGVDRGESSRGTYAFHMLLGHHGIFSLTPVWSLSVLGLLAMLRCRDERRWFSISVLVMSAVCMAFYVMRPEIDRNYGGVSSGFRWMFWFIPLYLLGMQPAVDWVSRRRWVRGLVYAMIAVGVFSVLYNFDNPWSHPWLFDYWMWLQWIDYS